MYNVEKFGDLLEAAGLARVQSAAITSTHVQVCIAPRELYDPNLFVVDAVGVVRQLLFRFVFTYVLEKALQLNVQTTLFAIQRSLAKGALTPPRQQSLVSAGFSLMLTFLKLLEAKRCFGFIHSAGGWRPCRLRPRDRDH